MKLLKFLGILFLSLVLVIGIAKTSNAQDSSGTLDELNRKIEEYTQQIKRLQSEAGTLSNQISQFNAQINLTQAKIEQTQEQISLLGGRIDQLEVSLDSLTKAFNSRVAETYKMTRIDDNPLLLLSTENINQAVATYHYLQKIQEADNMLIGRLDSARVTYNDQKTDLEELEKVLGAQRSQLDNQKASKASLLAITRNDEKRYAGCR